MYMYVDVLLTQRSLSWGFLIILLFAIVIITTSLIFVAVYYCCFKNPESDQHQLPRESNGHRCRKWSCGVFTIACGVCCV